MWAFGEIGTFRFSSKRGQKGAQNKYRVKPTVGNRFGNFSDTMEAMLNKNKNQNGVLECGSNGVGSEKEPMLTGSLGRRAVAVAEVQYFWGANCPSARDFLEEP